MNWNQALFPSLKGGVDARSRKCREATLVRADGVVRSAKSLGLKSFAELTTPSAALRRLRAFLLMPQPPLLFKLNNHALDSAGIFWQYWRVVVCGRDFTGEMISRIQAKVNAEPDLSRRQLSRQICEWLDWRKADGGWKEGSCRKALARLNRKKVLVLPERRRI